MQSLQQIYPEKYDCAREHIQMCLNLSVCLFSCQLLTPYCALFI